MKKKTFLQQHRKINYFLLQHKLFSLDFGLGKPSPDRNALGFAPARVFPLGGFKKMLRWFFAWCYGRRRAIMNKGCCSPTLTYIKVHYVTHERTLSDGSTVTYIDTPRC